MAVANLKHLGMIVVLLGIAFAPSGPAGAQGAQVTLVVPYVDAEIPLDPGAAVWANAQPVSIGLTEQKLTEPWGGGAVKTVSVRAVHNGRMIAFQMEWADDSVNDTLVVVDTFSDAVAIQFPVAPAVMPSPFMGDEKNPVNIWQWQAAWQRDVDVGGLADIDQLHPAYGTPYIDQEMKKRDEPSWQPGAAADNWRANRDRTTPVESLVALGFSTLTTSTSQAVQGRGVWANGVWKVVFERAIETGFDSDAALPLGGNTLFNVAVWEGSSGERGGRKSVSLIWHNLQIAGLAVQKGSTVAAPQSWWPMALIGLAGFILGAIIIWGRLVLLAHASRGQEK